VISASLFIIAFSELLDDLKSKGFDIGAYADDLVIVQNGRKKLNEAMDIVE